MKNVNGSEYTLMHKAEGPSNSFFSNSFTHYPAEQIKEGVICVQMFYVIHPTEHRRVHALGGTNSFTYLSWLLYCCCVPILITTFPEPQWNVSMATVWDAVHLSLSQ